MSSFSSTPPNTPFIERWLMIRNAMAPLGHHPRTRCFFGEDTPLGSHTALLLRQRLTFDDSVSPIRFPSTSATEEREKAEVCEIFTPDISLDFNGNSSIPYQPTPLCAQNSAMFYKGGQLPSVTGGFLNQEEGSSYGKRKRFESDDNVPCKLRRDSASAYRFFDAESSVFMSHPHARCNVIEVSHSPTSFVNEKRKLRCESLDSF